MNSFRARTAVAIALLASAGLLASACGSSTQNTAQGGKVTISVNGQPPQTQAFDRKVFDQDVAEFEASHPDIHIEPHEGFMDPKTFSAKLAGGQLEDVFYVYFTDPANLIARHQAADITSYLKDVPHVGDLQQQLRDVFGDGKGHTYGLPTANYSMGLLYNRTLFTRAGLNPDQPPRTWDDVRADAKKISALGNGTVGYADYSKSNQGGWHFTAWMYSEGGQVARKDGDQWKADFNNDKGRDVVSHLNQMRWADNSMGDKQLLELADVQQLMGAGQLGMYIAAPDNVPTLVNQFKGNYTDYGLASLPGGGGTLLGGEGYMLNPKATPEKIKAGLTWLQWKYLNPDRIEKKLQLYQADKQPVGLPVPPVADIWTGPVRDQQEQLKAKYATVPVANYQPYMATAATLPGHIEPPNAQQVYAALDNVMQAVLTTRDANVDQLLGAAETTVNAALAQVR
ncbi:extracellular solute-binding protein [Solihabitans fulvus]|uniref:Extracellular solute-binding protein n=1 Tax=Solihabitans fulvus TaxID=1892852 RepID=A0A5B2WW82_9PSEU|nr:extracellular solute-binding protein [Solihabitans fulvus]KAA2255981.1 extracellular solute-binding protein [Solihabitans fulvus]